MKLLFAIPHYYRPTLNAPDGRAHGSVGHQPMPRVEALTACLAGIRAVCAPKVCVLSHADRRATILEPREPVHADVIVCTVRNDHVLDQVPMANRFWKTNATNAQPPLLGYECHAVLRDHLGKYDFYCYLEDDIVLSDPGFFRKIAWFGRLFGDRCVLQPNRFETGSNPRVDKIYVDGDLPPICTAEFQDLAQQPPLTAEVFGSPVVFGGTTNPHAGCFFLNAVQMDHWARTPHFLDRADSFIGALESAATLGLVRSFKVYKPGLQNANFLEVRHHGTNYLSMIGSS
jgi:hypothetical protein